MISIDNLTKKYKKKEILLETSVSFSNEKVNLLLGDNGTGKTTLIYILAGIKKANAGKLFFNNKEFTYLDGKYRKDIGFLLDLPTFPYHYKVIEYVLLLKKIYSIKNSFNNNNYIEELISFFEIENSLNIKINQLSTGYIKRVKLFATMIHDPSYFVLDEPFSNLDESFRLKLINRIKKLSKKQKGFLITSHIKLNDFFDKKNVNTFSIENKKIIQLSHN